MNATCTNSSPKPPALRIGISKEGGNILQRFMGYRSSVMAQMGMQKEIAENILNWWGAQAREEVSTWAEAFEPEETHTLCHAFMCTPGFELPAYFLGIHPLTNAFSANE